MAHAIASSDNLSDNLNEYDDSTGDEYLGIYRCQRRRQHAASRWETCQRRPPRESELAAERARVRPAARRQRPNRPEEFRCRHCRVFVGAVPSGGRHRNHCPVCLHSRHVDDRLPGDRASACGGTMAPVGAFVRPNGEHTVVHRCFSCGIERHNRIAADDDFVLVLALPDVTRRVAGVGDQPVEGRRTSA